MKLYLKAKKARIEKKAGYEDWYESASLDLKEINNGLDTKLAIFCDLNTLGDELEFLMTPDDARSLAKELIDLANEAEVPLKIKAKVKKAYEEDEQDERQPYGCCPYCDTGSDGIVPSIEGDGIYQCMNCKKYLTYNNKTEEYELRKRRK